MPIQLVSSNLNTKGNTGQFENDRSTWGFADTSHIEFIRSAVQKTKGNYSARLRAKTTQQNEVPSLVAYYASVVSTKKYVAKLKVFVPSTAPIAAGAKVLTLYNATANLLFTVHNIVNKTVTQATNTWVTLELYFTPQVNGLGEVTLWIETGVDGLIQNGLLYADEFTLHEYIDVDEEPAPPDYFTTPYLSKNFITKLKGPVSGWDALTNYRHYLEVHVELEADTDEYTKTMEQQLPPELPSGSARFHIEEAFSGILTAVPPALNASTIIRLTDRVKRFKIFTGDLDEIEGPPAETLTESDVDMVLLGGIDKSRFPTVDYLGNYLPTNKKFLTWAPLVKPVDRQQEDYLNFWIYSDTITQIKLIIKAYFDDNTNTTDEIQTLSVTHGGLYQIPAGPANSGALLINPAKNVVKYELWLTNQSNTIISEVRTFTIDLVSHPRKRFFMFLNSLGAYEVLRFTGIASIKTEYQREVIKKHLAHNYSPSAGEFEINNSIMSQNESYSSGYVTPEWHEYLKDFLLTKRLYNVTSGNRLPVTITNSEHTTEDQDYTLNYIRFECKPAFDNHSYTPFTI